MNELNSIAAWATIISGLISIVAISLGLIQLFEIRRAKFAELRPYIELAYVTESRNKKTRVYLSMSNIGKTPAKNIKVEFQENRKWNNVALPDYAFLNEKGLHILRVGQNLNFFVGELGASKEFDRIRSESLQVILKYQASFSARFISESINISLGDLRYQSRKK